MSRPEDKIQEAVVQHLRTRGVPGTVWWHTPNGAVLGGKNKFAQLNALIKRGFRKGVADLILVRDGRVYSREIKAPGGLVSEDQLKFRDDMEKAKAYTCIAEGLDECLLALEFWGFLKRRAA